MDNEYSNDFHFKVENFTALEEEKFTDVGNFEYEEWIQVVRIEKKMFLARSIIDKTCTPQCYSWILFHSFIITLTHAAITNQLINYIKEEYTCFVDLRALFPFLKVVSP